MEIIIKQFKNIGIEGKEAELYLAILKLKMATVIKLARISGIKRTTIYHCLDSLIEKGLVQKMSKNGKNFYFAENPEDGISRLIEEKKSSLKNIIPYLKEMYGKGTDQPEIKIYRNIQGLRKIFEDSLKCDEKIARYFISEFNLEEILGEEFISSFVKKRIKAGIKSLSLRSFKYKPSRETNISKIMQLRQIKYMPVELIIKPYVCIYDNKVVMISSKEEKIGFIIESREFTEALKSIFDMLWNKIAI